MSVDFYEDIEADLSTVFTLVDIARGSKLIIQPTSEADIGLYTIRITFNVEGMTHYKDQLLTVNIIPEKGVNPSLIGEECQSDSRFQRHVGTRDGDLTSFQFNDVTFSDDGLMYCMTGFKTYLENDNGW